MDKKQYNKYLSYAYKVSKQPNNHDLVHTAWLAAQKVGKENQPAYVAKCMRNEIYDTYKKTRVARNNIPDIELGYYTAKSVTDTQDNIYDVIKLWSKLPKNQQRKMTKAWDDADVLTIQNILDPPPKVDRPGPKLNPKFVMLLEQEYFTARDMRYHDLARTMLTHHLKIGTIERITNHPGKLYHKYRRKNATI